MFCRFCGKEIEDNSKFCNYCGNELEDNIEKNKQNDNNISNENAYKSKKINENSGCGKSLLITIVVILIAFFTIFTIVKLIQNSDSTGGIFDKLIERDLEPSDYTVTTSQGLTSYTITITAKVKINACNIEIKLYDENGKVIYSDTQTKNDLLKGSSYTYTFDFGFVNALSADKINYKITGKCVS